MSSLQQTAPACPPVGAAVVVRGEKLSADLDVRARRQAALLACGRRTNAWPTLAVLLQDAVALLAEILQTELSGVAEVAANGARLVLRVIPPEAQRQTSQPLVHESPLGNRAQAAESSLAAYALQLASPVATSDLAAEKRFTDLFLRGLGVHSALCVPLHMNKEPLGALGVYTRQERAFTADDLGFAETIAHLLSSSIARAKAEEALREERALSSAVLALVDRVVMTLDAQGNVLSINEAGRGISGFSGEEIRGKPFCSVLAIPAEEHCLEEMLHRAVATKADCELESSVPTKDGSLRRFAWSLRPMCDRGGQVQSLVLSGNDRTEQIETLQQLQQAKAAAEQSARQIQELRALLAEHEFGTESDRTRSPSAPEAAASSAHQAAAGTPFHIVPTKAEKELRSSPRRTYQYRQLIAPMPAEGMPTVADFFAVECEDISAGGISFYLSAAPAFRKLMVALGKAPVLAYFAAEVVRVVEETVEGRALHLVGCRFVGRVPSETIGSAPLGGRKST